MNIHLSLRTMRTRDLSKENAIRVHALRTIVRNGFDGLSMQKLARDAGVSPATIYIYFRDREHLILELFREAGKKMTEATLDGFDPSMSFSEGLRLQWINRARFALTHPDEMRFLEKIRHSPLHQKSQELMDPRFRSMMKSFVTNAIRRKELDELPLEVYWSVAFAPLYSLIQFHHAGTSIGGRKFKFSEKTMLATLSLVLRALKP
jgi:TetR/AcrR family transcriptional repressor of multidrug resistance operon